jgi:hypothetical protein
MTEFLRRTFCRRMTIIKTQSLLGLIVHSCTHWLRPRSPPPPIWAHMRGRYWSAKIDDISLWHPAHCSTLRAIDSMESLLKLRREIRYRQSVLFPHLWLNSFLYILFSWREIFKPFKIVRYFICAWHPVASNEWRRLHACLEKGVKQGPSPMFWSRIH